MLAHHTPTRLTSPYLTWSSIQRLILLLALIPTLAAQSTNQCDLNGDNVVNVADVQIAINETLGLAACTMNLDATGTCDITDVQRVIAAALGGTCVVTPSTSTNITLPIEVAGPAGSINGATFNIPSGSNLSGTMSLSMQIHNLKYPTQVSVQVNNGSWIPINSSTVTLLGQANTFGGIGGGFSTLSMTMNLPSGSITTGSNTVTFRFNGSDGISSGFRVLNLNVLDTNGNQLIPQSSFTWDDPSTWQPPLNDPTDIAAGQTLWRTASLSSPGFGAIKATCGMCHAQDGRDLKYFNYSNLSIQARSMFHGLTSQQGNQIASYIRSLNTPAPASARPWNPPYQPGPGLDSAPVSEWSAGAGLSAVLAQDSDMLAYVMPNNSTANWSQSSYLNPRETPISFPLPDWNRWLPLIHPVDAFGSTFTNSSLNQLYLSLSSQLQPGNASIYANLGGSEGSWIYWLNYRADLMGPLTPPVTDSSWNNPTFVQQIYSVNLWSVVKNWELNQQFELEGLNQSIFGSSAPARGWTSNMPFRAGPGISGIPRPSPGLGNGSIVFHIWNSVSWYELQLILNNGYGGSIDWPYFLGYPTNDLTWDAQTSTPRVGTAGLLTLWLVSALQQDTMNDAQTPEQFVSFPSQASWSTEISNTQKLQIMNGYLTAWLGYYGAMTSAQFQALQLAQPFNTDPHQVQFGSDLIYALPQMRFVGVNSTLLSQAATWAAKIWPSYNWTSALNATCTVGNLSQVTCNTP